MSETQEQKTYPRPLSPHLQVYRLPIMALLSISHRASGMVLTLGAILVTAILVSAAMGEEYFNIFMDFAKTPLGTVILFGWSLALFYHLCSGTRHLMMDIGFWIKERSIGEGVAFVILGTILLTASVWYYAYEYKMDKAQPVAEEASDEQ